MYKLIDQGDVPAYKVGWVFRIRRSDLDDFVERCRVKPGELAHLYPLDHEEPDERLARLRSAGWSKANR